MQKNRDLNGTLIVEHVDHSLGEASFWMGVVPLVHEQEAESPVPCIPDHFMSLWGFINFLGVNDVRSKFFFKQKNWKRVRIKKKKNQLIMPPSADTQNLHLNLPFLQNW